jgi:protein SCO1/2
MVAILLAALLLPGSRSIAAPQEEVGLTERLGDRLPLETRFRDEEGREVRLGDLITGPTIIMPVYYRCPNVCAHQQARLASVTRKLERTPGTDYRLISVSFDETEGPDLAARSRRTYLAAARPGFPPEGWRFLTGTAENIRRLTDAAGYRFRRQGADFDHPVASLVVTGDGTIVRYLYGLTLLPKDVALALAEAASGVTGSSIRTLMAYCFTYDPDRQSYLFNLLRVSGTVVVLTVGGLLAYLLLGGTKRTKGRS